MYDAVSAEPAALCRSAADRSLLPGQRIEGARTTLPARSNAAKHGTGDCPSDGQDVVVPASAEQFRGRSVLMLQSGRLSSARLFSGHPLRIGPAVSRMDEGETRLAVIDYLMAATAARAAWCCWWTRPIPCRFVCWKKSAC